MLKTLLHRLVAVPQIYDWVQVAVGARYVQKRLKRAIAPLQNAARVLDLGGGTGLHRELWSGECAYVCLDFDAQKLRGYRARHADGLAVQGDATCLPLQSGSVDVVMCTFVAHHISDALLHDFAAEAMRVLAPGGHLVFLDPLWRKNRRVSRLLWKYDRGSHPRTSSQLHAVLSRHGRVQTVETFAVLHAYYLCILAKS